MSEHSRLDYILSAVENDADYPMSIHIAKAELSALRARVAEFEQRREFDAGVIEGLNVAIKIKDERIDELELSAANGTEIMWQNAKLTKRVAELEAAQAATLAPRKCAGCHKAAEQMREAAAEVFEQYVHALRWYKAHALGLGDVRVTIGQCEEIARQIRALKVSETCPNCHKPIDDAQMLCDDCAWLPID